MKFPSLSVFPVHARTKDKNNDEKEEFYSLLDSDLGKIPMNDIKLINGVQRYVEKKYTFILQQFIPRNNGENGIHFAPSQGLRIRSTSFAHEDIE